MSDRSWNIIKVGGKISAQDYLELLRLSFSEYAHDTHFVTEGAGTDDHHILYFCQDHGLHYQASWASYPGSYSAGLCFWHPGMDSPCDREADDLGNPLVGLPVLQMLTTIEQAREWVTLPPVPPLEITP